MLLVLLVTMGIGLLGSRAAQYRGAVQSELAARARALARAGIEDARSKLNRDIAFPPPANSGRTSTPAPHLRYHPNLFRYGEKLYDVSETIYLGRYEVTVDGTNQHLDLSGEGEPFLTITATGFSGPEGSAPMAVHSYRAYLNLNPSSAAYFRITRWEDLGIPNWAPPSGGL